MGINFINQYSKLAKICIKRKEIANNRKVTEAGKNQEYKGTLDKLASSINYDRPIGEKKLGVQLIGL